MGFPGGLGPNDLAGQLLREKEALARQDEMKRAGAEHALKRRKTSARSAWIEVAVIIGVIAGVATVAGILVTIL